MILGELFDPNREAADDPADDQSIPTLNDVRKVKLTLGMINKLRLMHDVRKFELELRLTQIQQQYAAPATGQGI